MTDNSESRPEEALNTSVPEDAEEPIELSDIAIDTPDEGDEIIELTEEVVDEAVGAVSDAMGGDNDAEPLELEDLEPVSGAEPGAFFEEGDTEASPRDTGVSERLEEHEGFLDEAADDCSGIDSEEPIELSDIAIGTTEEDDEIIELTEEVVDEAIGAVSGTRGEDTESEPLDLTDFDALSEEQPGLIQEPGDTEGPGQAEAGFSEEQEEPEEPGEPGEPVHEDFEDHIDRELDEFFGEEEEKSRPDLQEESPASAVSSEMLDDSLERVVQKIYSEKIDQMIRDMIREEISREIDRIKQRILESLES